MRIEQQMGSAISQLQAAGIETARLDVLVLLEDILGHDRSWVLAHPEAELNDSQTAQLQKLLMRRAKHEPLAYVRGRSEFYGRVFAVSAAVLEPRPESETMIEVLKSLTDLPALPCIADVGTGSGALGITAALELPGAQVTLLDIDEAALQVAKTNVDLFTLTLPCLISDLLASTNENYDLLLCNLPYVPDDFAINLAATHEPAIAIFGGPDGLDLYRKLFEQIKNRPTKPLYILTEALPTSHKALATIASDAGYELLATDDFIQTFHST